MKWISEAVKNAPPALIGEILKIASEYKNVISLSLGEPDFDTPPHVVEAGITALKQGFTHYTSNLGILELREAICEKLEKDNNVYVTPDEVMAAAGAGTAIDLLMRAVLNPGDEVLVQDPGYFNYIFIAAYIGAKIVPIHVTEENGFALNPQDLEEKITDKTKLLILNSPANPTGSVIPEKHLRKIADIAIEKDLLVLTDEIYEKLIYDESHFSVMSIPEMKERCVLINGFSKAYAMTGWRIGYAAGCKEVIEKMGEIQVYSGICPPGVSQKAAVAALKGDQECIRRMWEEYNKRRPYMVNRLNQIGIPTVMPKGAFYAFPNISEYGKSEYMWKLFLEKAHVAVTPGTAFGVFGEGYLRFSYANSLENIEKALNNIEEVISNV
ncbi:MAG: pyridoxal phosphate-dependent aminotransferase [Theionarchaea archaeon]|nr:pyridoxal phosphate-dependent aminotransferase [Theionarchaea archaeon]